MAEQFDPAWEYFTGDPEIAELLIQSTVSAVYQKLPHAKDERSGKSKLSGVSVLSRPDGYRSFWPLAPLVFKPTKQFTCRQCDTLFNSTRQKAVYCSMHCAGLSRRKPIKPRNCQECGKSFYRKSDRVKFCSYICATEFRNRNRLSVQRQCLHCTKQFKTVWAQKRFCTVSCRNAFQGIYPGRLLRHIPCERCTTMFLPKASRTRFCSKVCGTAGNGAKRTLSDKQCPCGRTFRPSHRSTFYCSLSCRPTGKKRLLPDVECGHCHTLFRPKHSIARFCSRTCFARNLSEKRRDSIKAGEKPSELS